MTPTPTIAIPDRSDPRASARPRAPRPHRRSPLNRATAAAPPTHIEFLRGLSLRDGSPVPDYLLATEGSRYLDELEAAALGRGPSAARPDLAPGSDAAFTHERRLHSFCDHHAAAVGEYLFEAAQLALV